MLHPMVAAAQKNLLIGFMCLSFDLLELGTGTRFLIANPDLATCAVR